MTNPVREPAARIDPPAPSVYVAPGFYLSFDGHIIRVTANQAGTRVYAQRMVVVGDADGCPIIDWVYEPGLGRDLLIVDLPFREASRRIRATLAA